MDKIGLFLIFIGWGITYGLLLLSPVGFLVSCIHCVRTRVLKEPSDTEEYFRDCRVEFYLALIGFIFTMICFILGLPVASKAVVNYNAFIYSVIFLITAIAYYKLYPALMDRQAAGVMREPEQERGIEYTGEID